MVLVIVIEYQISTLEVNAKENGRFSSVGRMNLRSDWLTKEITTVIHQQNEIKDFFSEAIIFQEHSDPKENALDGHADNLLKDNELYPITNEPIRYQRRWADYSDQALDYQNEQIFQEQLSRFEASLTDVGRVELENRIQLKIEQRATGTIPGFESLEKRIGKESDLLLADVNTLTPRRRSIRERMLKRMKEASLMEMHAEYTGLFDGGLPPY